MHLWDLREPQIRSKDQDDDRKMRPSCSFTPWTGKLGGGRGISVCGCVSNLTTVSTIAAATQVKFNRKSEYLIASAHDKDVKIWDLRVSDALVCVCVHTRKRERENQPHTLHTLYRKALFL